MDDSGVPLFQDFRKPPCLLGRKNCHTKLEVHLYTGVCSLQGAASARDWTIFPKKGTTHLILSKFPWEAIAIMGKKIRVIRFVFPSALQGQWKIPNPLRSWRWPSFCHQVTWRSSRIPAGSQNLKSTSLHRTCTFFLNVFESSHFGFQSLLSPDLDHSATPHSSLGA
jgi:hypothetical protein